jgi:hypothetical protein
MDSASIFCYKAVAPNGAMSLSLDKLKWIFMPLALIAVEKAPPEIHPVGLRYR